jgi:methyl-accepting chemotaxis protein
MTHSWSFQKKLGAGFGVMFLLAASTTAVAILSLRSVVAIKDRVINVNSENLINAAQLDVMVERQASAFRGFLANAEDRFLSARDAATQEFGAILNECLTKVSTEEERSLLANVQRTDAELVASQDRLVGTRRGPNGLAAVLRVFEDDTLPKRERLAQAIRASVTRQHQILDAAVKDANQRASTAMTVVVILALVSLVFAFAAALLLSRVLSRQIGAAVQHVQSSSAELQTTANQQATGARETATSMNEISTTMSELLVTSRQISESAQQVATMSQETGKAAQSGDESVGKMQESIETIKHQVDIVVNHMLDLGKKSQQIGGILDIINELAEQTNILSINATIEAAGAGEAGKRFGVVGDEIRKLADRVTSSTREIRTLVEEIRSAVNTTVLATEGGSKAVDAGLRHFEEVTRGFKQITGLVVTAIEAAREIELSTKQQMTAVEQVNTAITGAAQASREAETSTAQTLQTATQLAHLSHNLSQIVQPHAA